MVGAQFRGGVGRNSPARTYVAAELNVIRDFLASESLIR